jgi:hypothetical protein
MRVSICQVLDAVDELGQANPQLVAWELSLLDRDIDWPWQVVEARGYVKRAHLDEITKEPMYELTRRGRRQLKRCRRGRA